MGELACTRVLVCVCGESRQYFTTYSHFSRKGFCEVVKVQAISMQSNFKQAGRFSNLKYFIFQIAVFLSPTIAVLLSTFGFNIFHHDIHEYFLWLYHISYFRAAFHSLVVSMYGHNRTTLPCEQLYCHYKYPDKFLYEMDIRDVSISENTIFVGSVGLFLHLCTVTAIWIRLNRR